MNTVGKLQSLYARDTFRAAFVLAVVLHICFFPCIWGNKTFLASAEDAPSVMPSGAWAGKPVMVRFPKMLDEGAPGFVTEPLLKLIGYDYLHEKTVPLWNPYQGYGAPLAANMQSQPFYPLSALLSFHLTPRTYNWYILLRLFLAGICMYWYLRRFVSFTPALGGAIASMLSGYYVLFITMPQLSVEVLLPAGLLAVECLLKSPRAKTVIWFAVVLFLIVVGGMPESTLLVLSFLYVYLLFRFFSDEDLRSDWLRRAKYVVFASVAGLCLSAFLVLPFWEFMSRSFDMHQPSNIGILMGLMHDQFNVSIFTYFFPLLFGAPGSNTLALGYAGLRNYVGVVGLFLILLTIPALFRTKSRSDRKLRLLTWFFLVFLVLVVLKRYGFWPVNLIGALPLFRLVWFGKYAEVILSACASVLFAIGLERLLTRAVSLRVQVCALCAASLAIPLALLTSWRTLVKGVSVDHVLPSIPSFAVCLAIGALFSLSIVLILLLREWPDTEKSRIAAQRLAVAVLVILAAELSFNYIVPVYYLFNRIPRQSRNPYVGAPYVDLLKAKRSDGYRVFARDGLLFPNWASAFQQLDIRNLDALYTKTYFPFVRAFLAPGAKFNGDDDLNNRFNGTGTYELKTPLARRLLQLSSVKYIATVRPFTASNSRIEEMLNQDRQIIAASGPSVARREFVLAGQTRDGILEHPPHTRLPYRLKVGNNGHTSFHFSYALDPAVFDKAGDGVGFTIEVRDPSGAIAKVFSKYIDPKHNPAERRWMDGELDLSRYKGQVIDLLFSTDPGPKGDTSYDWSTWSDFHFDGEQTDTEQPFRLIYNGSDAMVYAYDNILPRAAVYNHAELCRNNAAVLSKLADPSIDVFRTVLLDESQFNPGQRQAIVDMNRGAAASEQPAQILSYKSRSVEMKTSSSQAGILVLNDTGYPGWTVDVDNRPSQWFTANYLFRGVLLSPGTHTVRFAYRPKSFQYGATISFVSLLSLVAFAFFERRKNARPAVRTPLTLDTVASAASTSDYYRG